MQAKGKRHQTIPIAFGGEFTAGEKTNIPDGTVLALRNYMVRPNRFDGRAPFVYDTLTAAEGFAIWTDLVNEVTNTMALTPSSDLKLYKKNTNGDGWATGLSGLTASKRLTSFTNLLGKLYMMFDDGAGVPSTAFVYDGTTLSSSPFNTPIVGRTVTAYNDRIFITDPRVTVVAANGLTGYMTAYDWTVAKLNNCKFVATAVSSTTVGRLYIAATSGVNVGGFTITTGTAPDQNSYTGIPIASSLNNSPVIWRQDLRSTSGSLSTPLHFQIMIVGPNWLHSHAYSAGDCIIDTVTGDLFRCTTAGTSSATTVPLAPATIGGTVTDGTATWTLEQTGSTSPFGSVIGDLDNQLVPPNTGSGTWSTFWTTGTVPPATNTLQIATTLIIGSTSTTTYTETTLDVSLKDGLADGVVNKQNYGCQLTTGDFFFPFFNQESSATATGINLDVLIWTEIDNPKAVLAKNTYPLSEIAGLATASAMVNGRLVVFKRRGMWIFQGVADINEPVLPEVPAIHVGAIGPLVTAISRDNMLYWIGEQHIYQMMIGNDIMPVEIDSPGMYEEIMARGSNWVESQSTYNLPLLAVDHTNKDLWIYTQKGKIYIYHIESRSWGYIDTNPTGTAAEVQAMIFDEVGQRMLVSFGGNNTTRFDETSDAQDSVAGVSTFWDIQNDIVPKPLELFAPRYEATLLEIGLFHLASIQQGTITLSYSYDRGVTYTTPGGYPVSTYLSAPRIRMPLAATGPSVTIKLSRTGAGGSRNWSISKADALLRVHRGEIPYVNAT